MPLSIQSSLWTLLLVLPVLAAQPRPAKTSAMVSTLMAEEWQYQLQRSPTYASVIGDRRWNDRWDDLSLESLAADHQHNLAVLKRLEAIPRAALSAEDQLNLDVLQRHYVWWVREFELGWHFLPLNQLGHLPEGVHQPPGVQAAGQVAANLRFSTVRDYQDWLSRMDRFGTYVDQVIALMREGARRKLVHPRVVLQRIPAQLDKQLAESPEKSVFYAPFTRFPASFTPSDRQRLATAGTKALQTQVLPALRRLRAFLVDTYLPAAPEPVGAWQWPRGEELYAYWAQRHTTTDLTPEQLHTLGLSEVARLHAEMERVKASTGFRGTMQEFFNSLRTDPRFYFRTGDELLVHYRDVAKRIDPRLIRLFRTLPRMPYGVEPTPSNMAPDVSAGFYYQGALDGSRPGTYLVNLYRPETRPRWEMVPLTLHEAVPGHHLQFALTAEKPGLPEFRRYSYETAYGEGWALYCETLGGELGVLDDPYDQFGQLTFEMWRAARLVVDTGMHVKRWTRAQAIAYLLENTARNELDVTNEVDRYIALPGQALAYKVGQLKIRELRTRAERALGAGFDVRAFHDAVLLDGPLPLDLLERRIDRWIADQGQARR